MKLLIIEDEKLAQDKLWEMISAFSNTYERVGVLDSVGSSIEWFQQNPQPDIAFVDIHLADGTCFDLFDAIDIECPVIFTTAYDEYAIQAFSVLSLDYLLKPLQQQELNKSLEKFEAFHNRNGISKDIYTRADELYKREYKTRFISKIGNKITSIEVKDVQFIFTENKGVYLYTTSKQRHLVDYTLEQLELILDPKYFFRLNRQYIVTIEAIKEVRSYSSSRLKVWLNDWNTELFISRDKSSEFKTWLDR